jgi:hypothetical protein
MIQPNRLRRFVAVGACALALATGVGLLARSSAPRPAYANPLAAGDRIADTAERVVDSVVNISTTQAVARGPFAFDPFWNDPGSPSFGQADPRRASSLGSGVIVSTDGRVLTNAHVIGDAEGHPRDVARWPRARRDADRRRSQERSGGAPARAGQGPEAAGAQAAAPWATRRSCAWGRSSWRSAIPSASARR